MAYSLSAIETKQLKRVLATRLPDVGSSRLTEAMARGLCFSTNAALLSALGAGPISASPDDAAFTSFLNGREGTEVPDGVMTAALSAVMFPEEHRAIMAVMARDPDLSSEGMRTRENRTRFPVVRQAMLQEASIREFQRAVEWLGTVRQTSRIGSKRTSYGYKHEAERHHQERYPGQNNYVSNGMFIAAALHLGFRTKRDDWDSPNVRLNLAPAAADERARKRARSDFAGSLRGAKNLRAWRNLMVAGINAGLAQQAFGLGPDENCWSGSSGTFHFEFDGLPAIASVSDAGFGELSVKVAVSPTARAAEWIGTATAGFLAGDAFASGYLERKLGAWLQTTANPTGSFRRILLDRLSAVTVVPMGFADTGRFMM